ncbi:MAG: type VI secretion system baseplate subunit TssE [Planctomycetes bacterium]|nr:type VI secretion system baseplate subunit TssE [Planctomycetota bacterium]
MPNERELALRMPLLHALIDEEPEKSVELRPSSKQQLRELRESVRLDLQNLLNTRHRCRSWPKELLELERSVFDYGIPDLSGAHLTSAARRKVFLEQLGTTIRRHDARFQSVKVESLDNPDPQDRTLRFRVEAMMRVETESETAVFDFQIEPVSRQVESFGKRSE